MKSSCKPLLPAKMTPVRPKVRSARVPTWPPEGSTSNLPPTRTDFGDFVWCSAVVWICTRNLAVTRAFHTGVAPARMNTREADARLDRYLAERGPLTCTRVAAEEALTDALSKGIVPATATDPGGAIPTDVWLSWEPLHDGPHDNLQCFASGATYLGVRLGSREILARWLPSPSQLLDVLGGSTWSLPATAYWIHHGTHRGFEPTTSLRGLAEALENLRFELRVGSIACWAAVHDGVLSVPEDQRSRRKRPAKFWVGHGFSDTIDSQFEAAAIIAKWTGEYANVVAGCKIGEAAKKLQAEVGMRSRPARELAQRLVLDGRTKAGIAQARAQIKPV